MRILLLFLLHEMTNPKQKPVSFFLFLRLSIFVFNVLSLSRNDQRLYFQQMHGNPSLTSLLKNGGVSCSVSTLEVTHPNVVPKRPSLASAAPKLLEPLGHSPLCEITFSFDICNRHLWLKMLQTFISDAYQHEIRVEKERRIQAEKELDRVRGRKIIHVL